MTGSGTQTARCDPAVSREAANRHSNLTLPERDKPMSEQKPRSFMQELDQWIEEEVFENLYAIWNESQDGNMNATAESVKKAIREKVLESYKNGIKAGAKPAGKAPHR